MVIRPLTRSDLPGALAIWRESAANQEVVLRPLTLEQFDETFTASPHYEAAFDFVAEEEGEVVGWVNGIRKRVFLPGENEGNAPGYLNLIFVKPAFRGRGVGGQLLGALEAAFRAAGKTRVDVASTSPIDLGWLIPGKNGHDHNNAPGVDVDCAGFGFLLHHGYADWHREVAMYLDLADYRPDPAIEQTRARLAGEGIYVGRYDVALNYEFDGMCDRVGSEYWRQVLREEVAKAHPRPLLVGSVPGHIVAFTGPVDRQISGRGYFTGICTDPNYERRGIATVLFNDLMREFIAVGAEFSTLFTGETNHAQRLYLRTGFSVARTFSIMRKEL